MVDRRSPESKWGFVAIATGIVLGGLSIAVSSFHPLWSLFGVDAGHELEAVQSTALATFFVIVGFLAALYLQQRDFNSAMVVQQSLLRSKLLAEQTKELNKILSSIPSAEIFTHYSGDEAMSHLTVMLPTIAVALNTRLLSKEANATRHPTLSPWDNAVRTAIQNGLTFRDVLSQGNEEMAQGRLQAFLDGDGSYEAVTLSYALPSFLNFILLYGRDGSREVWFGWIVSKQVGYEGTVIKTRERRIFDLFERWHRELFIDGTPLHLESDGSIETPSP